MFRGLVPEPDDCLEKDWERFIENPKLKQRMAELEAVVAKWGRDLMDDPYNDDWCRGIEEGVKNCIKDLKGLFEKEQG